MGSAIGAVVITAPPDAVATVLPALVTRAGPVYGSFATVVGTFTLLYLISQTLILTVEISAVTEGRLSPRGLTNALRDAARSLANAQKLQAQQAYDLANAAVKP